MVRVAWCGGYALTGAPASSDVGYEPRHCQQGNHHDDREAIVFEPWTKFALPLWSNCQWHVWIFFNSQGAKETRGGLGLCRATCVR